MNLQTTLDYIETTILRLEIVTCDLKYTGETSLHIQQARFDQFIQITNQIITDLEKIKETIQ